MKHRCEDTKLSNQRGNKLSTMFLVQFYFLFFAVFINAGPSFADSGSEDFPMCHQKISNFEECVQESIMKLKPHLMKGVPEIQLPPMDPLFLSSIKLKEKNDNFQFSAFLGKIYMAGLSDMTVHDVRIYGDEYSNMTINFTVKAPKLHLFGKYAINGNFLILRLDGEGDITANITEPVMKITINGHPEIDQTDGRKYLIVDSLKTDLQVTGGKVYLKDLFKGDIAGEKVANTFINDNLWLISKSLKHFPEEYFSRTFERIAKIFFNIWPIDELMPY